MLPAGKGSQRPHPAGFSVRLLVAPLGRVLA